MKTPMRFSLLARWAAFWGLPGSIPLFVALLFPACQSTSVPSALPAPNLSRREERPPLPPSPEGPPSSPGESKAPPEAEPQGGPPFHEEPAPSDDAARQARVSGLLGEVKLLKVTDEISRREASEPATGSDGTEASDSRARLEHVRELLAKNTVRQADGKEEGLPRAEGVVLRGGDPPVASPPQAPPPAAPAQAAAPLAGTSQAPPPAPQAPPAAAPGSPAAAGTTPAARPPQPAPPPAPASQPLAQAVPAQAPPPGATQQQQQPGAPANPSAPGQQPGPPQQPGRPRGLVAIKEMYHKTADEFIRFVKDNFPEWIERGNVAKVEAKGRSIVILGETADANDPTAKKIAQIMDSFDDLELKVESRVIRPRYVDARLVMDTLAMRGLANIWRLTEETSTATWTEGKNTMQAVSKRPAFAQTSLVTTGTAPVPNPPKVPYVYEVPSRDPFEVPKVYSGAGATDQVLVAFNSMSSTEQRGGIVAVGTLEDLERIQAFIDSIDVPARQIMIEVQVIELDANKLVDIGFDSFQLGQNHTLGTGAFPLPGENIIQPGLTSVGRDGPPHIVPPVTQQGLGLIFDDTALDLTGRFMTTLHALVRVGDATVKARPKILTLDDRVSVLHIGQEVPIFKSTGVTRDSVNGNLISEVNQVGTQYVGFTLNMRPRVSGGAEDEVSLQIEVIVNELGERQRVFAEDLLGIPTVTKRQYVGQNRVKNHRPIILGGLIQEADVESVNKIPLLADVPLLGYLFRRTQKTQSRTEVILVLTPHILSDKGVDRIATPKESAHFDTFDSILFNDRHIIKGRDVIGIDPITGNPAQSDGKIFTEEEVIDLTLLNIVKERELVSKLRIIDDYLGDAARQLNWIQRRFPEATVRNWSPREQEIYFRAAAIVIENIKELNPDLKYEEIITPRREIVLPTTPYRISLTYDRVKSLQSLASPILLRGERVELTEGTVALMREASGRSLRDFADFLEGRKRKPEEHGELLSELKRFYSGQNPSRNALEGISYPDVYRELAAAKFDFVSLATYFQENLADRYRNVGPPNTGAFEADLKAFLETSISLHQRAKKLMELDTKWTKLNSEASENDATAPGKP